jgi:LysR family cyn operon transcriptional activator
MELRHLRYFSVLAEQLNFTRAAEKLHVTQSTLSHQIKQLEDELGTELLDRRAKQLSLTHAGQHFLQSAERAIEELDSAVRHLKSTSAHLTGRLTIGATHTFCLGLIGQHLAAYLRRYPLVKIELFELPASVIEERLRDESLDVGIAYTPSVSPLLWSEPLFTESLVFVVGRHHPFASRRRMRMVELHRQHLALLSPEFATRRMLDDCFTKAGAEPVVVMESNTFTPILALVKEQPIGTIMSERGIPSDLDLQTIILQDPSPNRTAALLWKKGRHYPQTAQEFSSIVKSLI